MIKDLIITSGFKDMLVLKDKRTLLLYMWRYGSNQIHSNTLRLDSLKSYPLEKNNKYILEQVDIIKQIEKIVKNDRKKTIRIIYEWMVKDRAEDLGIKILSFKPLMFTLPYSLISKDNKLSVKYYQEKYLIKANEVLIH